jgi:hypothetical protein
MVIKWAMGILHRDGRVLVGRLRKKNDLVRRLDWTFPFTTIQEDESPRLSIKRLFKNELGVDVVVGKHLFNFVPSENPKVEMLFYEVLHKGGFAIASRDYAEFGWVKPTQVIKFFTTSLSSEMMDYLRGLEKDGKGLIIQ